MFLWIHSPCQRGDYCNILQYWLNSLIHCHKIAVPESNFTQAFFASASAPIAQPFVPDMSGYGDQGHEVVPYAAGAVDHYEHQHPRCAHQELALSFSTMRSFGKRTCSFYEALQARRVPLPLNSESEKKQKLSPVAEWIRTFDTSPFSILWGARWHNP